MIVKEIEKQKCYRALVMLIVASLSTVETLGLVSIKDGISSYIKGFDLFIVVLPIVATFVSIWTSGKASFKLHKIEYKKSLEYVKSSFIVATFLYLVAILVNFSVINKTKKVILLIICFGTIFSSYMAIKSMLNKNNNLNEKSEKKKSSRLFNIYYLNISKVFEIAMLINNKIATSISNERIVENSEELRENVTANINSEYLKLIKSSITYDDSYAKINSEKNKVLENFDVKTTKSNLLDSIIKEAKKYKAISDIKIGDLLIFDNVKLKLLNEEETMQVTRMLLNGAFNGSNISSTSNEMKMDLSMSSLFNSFLKDCSYELECSIDGFSFYIKIPMSFENDFESNYNIYDLLIGKMTIVGIYRGQDLDKKYKNSFEFFSNNQNKTNEGNVYISGLKKSSNNTQNKEVAISKEINKDRTRQYVDIIAIIQDINI